MFEGNWLPEVICIRLKSLLLYIKLSTLHQLIFIYIIIIQYYMIMNKIYILLNNKLVYNNNTMHKCE